FGNNFWGEVLIPYGVLLALAGLAYLTAFASRTGTATDLGYQTALAVGALGAAAFLVGAVRSALGGFLVPWGLLFMGLGLLYLLVSLALWSDSPVVVLTRRELAGYFYSPLAYIILVGLMLVGWFLFLQFVYRLAFPDP